MQSLFAAASAYRLQRLNGANPVMFLSWAFALAIFTAWLSGNASTAVQVRDRRPGSARVFACRSINPEQSLEPGLRVPSERGIRL